MWYFLMFFVFCFLPASLVEAQYKIPEVLLEALSPKGLRISIPDQKDLIKFSVNANINVVIKERREPTLFGDVITKPVNNRWTFFDESARLKIGDVIYYRIEVVFFDGAERISFYKGNLTFTVTDHLNQFPERITTEYNGIINRSGFTTPILPTVTTTTTQKYLTEATTKQPVPETSSTTQRSTIDIHSTVPETKSSTTQQVSTETTTQQSTTKPTQKTDCKNTPTTVNGKPSCRDKLIFQDIFSEISDKRWQTEIRFAQEPDYEFVIYQEHAENLYINKSMLCIKPTLVDDRLGPEFVSTSTSLDLGENCTGVLESYECIQKSMAWAILPPVFSAQISTKDRFSFLYGVIEIRARLPKGDWIYPQLFLKSRSDYYGSGYDSGLIKIAFTPGNADLSKQLSGGGVLGESRAARNYGIKSIRSTRDWNNEFHIFRMIWAPSHISLTVDGQTYGSIYPPDGGFTEKAQELNVNPATAKRWRRGNTLAPFDKEMYLTLGVGVGGASFVDKKDGSKPWNNDDPKAKLNFYKAQNIWKKTWTNSTALMVDYVKIWAL